MEVSQAVIGILYTSNCSVARSGQQDNRLPAPVKDVLEDQEELRESVEEQ